MTHPQFRKFAIDWSVYKKMTRLPTSEIASHLYSTCDASVQSTLIHSFPNFLELPEDEMLETIESVVTKRVNPAVHRMNFGNLVQHESESIQEFLVRNRTLAIDCEFSCPDCQSDISKVHIKDQFIRGLHNIQLQTDVLAKASNLKSIDDVLKHAEAFETALQDQSTLQNSAEAHAARASSYRRQKQQPSHHNKTCNGCGSTEYGIPGMPPRHSHCPAWGKTCSFCKRQNHMSAVCRQPSSARGLLAHMQYKADADHFTSVNALEEIPASLTPDVKGATTVSLHVLPDSGANICLAGPKQLTQLGLTPQQLRPCAGWIPVKFELAGHATTQPLFVCNKVDRLYFSKQGCIELSILPSTFPRPMITPHPSSATLSNPIRSSTGTAT